MALFSAGRRSPQVSGCGVHKVRFAKNLCAALPSEKNSHFWIGNCSGVSVLCIETNWFLSGNRLFLRKK
jgi:hypothetical protein